MRKSLIAFFTIVLILLTLASPGLSFEYIEIVEAATILDETDFAAELMLQVANGSYSISSEGSKALSKKRTFGSLGIVATTFNYRMSDMPQHYDKLHRASNPEFLKTFWTLRKLGFESSEIYANLGNLDLLIKRKSADSNLLGAIIVAASAANDSAERSGGSAVGTESYRIDAFEATNEYSINASVYENWGEVLPEYQKYAPDLARNTSRDDFEDETDVAEKRRTIYAGFLSTKLQIEGILKANIAANESTASDTIDPDRVEDLEYDIDYAQLTQYVSEDFAKYVRDALSAAESGSQTALVITRLFGFELQRSVTEVPYSFLHPIPAMGWTDQNFGDAAEGSFDISQTASTDTSGLFGPDRFEDPYNPITQPGQPPPPQVPTDPFDLRAWRELFQYIADCMAALLADNLDKTIFDGLGLIQAALKKLTSTVADLPGFIADQYSLLTRNITDMLKDATGNLIAGPFLSMVGGILAPVSRAVQLIVIAAVILVIAALIWIVYRKRKGLPIVPV